MYGADGAPLAGVKLHVHHTDGRGYYFPPGARDRTPRLQGTLVTGPDGRYEFRTIRPAAYPGRDIPAHIHFKASAPGHAEQNPVDLMFEGDPLITDEVRKQHPDHGRFSAIQPLTRDASGVLRCERNIQLRR